MRFLIITEANQKVATGHFMEVCELSKELVDKGHEVKILINHDCPLELLNRFPNEYLFYNTSISKDLSKVSRFVEEIQPSEVITNLREVQNADILKLKEITDVPVICIDEFGHRTLDADVIINPMVDSSFWEYPGSSGKLYSGHQYLALPRCIKAYHDRDKTIKKDIAKVCVSMGGVDPYGTTVKIVEWLPQLFNVVEVDVILGAGFRFDDELEEATRKLPQTIRINIQKNVKNIYDYFFDADIAFCAGGNTLHELACIGTPTLVIPSMPHEINNGKEFEKMGAVKCLKQSDKVCVKEIKSALEKMTDKKRIEMSRCGKTKVDGKGLENTSDICIRLVDKNVEII